MSLKTAQPFEGNLIAQDSENSAIRILLIGYPATGSPLATELDAAFDLEFALPEAILNGWRPGARNAILLDAQSIAREGRSKLVQDVVESLQAVAPRTKLVTFVPSNDRRTAEVAIESGAWDVATQKDRHALVSRLHIAAACQQVEDGEVSGSRTPTGMREMVGTSPPMRRVFSLIRQVGATSVPVLITGESGTGKELAALAIHQRSVRANGPFVPINCAAIPEALLESELFGHERGAFTGAVRTSSGMVEAADNGTLFLDEVGELAPGLQAKLLRFLGDHIIERVGSGGKRFPVDVRIIAATNRDLASAVDAGEFRRDLYYRLAVFPLEMPPLRERGDDVLLMARILLDRYAREAERKLRGFSPDAMDALLKCSWPGNVRQLINQVRRAVVVADGPLVSPADLGFEQGLFEAPLLTLRESLARAEVDSVRRALERSRGNRCQAARLLGISRSTLYELLHRHQLA